jgi:hypothetical protein
MNSSPGWVTPGKGEPPHFRGGELYISIDYGRRISRTLKKLEVMGI